MTATPVRRAFTTRRLAVVLLAVAAGAALAPTAGAATRPPPPKGLPVLSPGQLPRPCAAGDEKYGATGQSSVSGTYYDTRVKQWVSAPYCYPVWGNLTASGPQIVNPGEAATVAAISDTNSATFAPQTNSISWTYAGVRKSGCGRADLSCSMVPAPRATGSWQWFQVQVSMPRIFFVDSPGSNCAGQHLCAGFATNAWSWIGVRPSAVRQGFIRGRVVDPDGDPVEDVRVTASGPDSGAGTTNGSGRYEIQVDRAGTYRVSATSDEAIFSPRQRSVKVPKGGTGTANFELTGCKRTAGASLAGAPSFVPVAWAAKDPCGAKPDKIDWLMEKRFTAASVEDWDSDGFPSGREVNPTSWTATLYTRTGGEKFPCNANVRFVWTVKQAAQLVGGRQPKVGCKSELHVKRLGTYDVTAQMQRRKAGKGLWRDFGKPVRGKVKVHDWLIVGIGDSNGSGEGNASFYYQRCNRSIAAYQMQTAFAVERNDPHSSVTFIHTSCSGASTDHLFSATYAGTRGGSPPLEPQIMQVQRLLSARGTAPRRDVDAALMSIGVNDLSFGPVLKFCIDLGLSLTTIDPCEVRRVRAIRHQDGKRTGKYVDDPRGRTLAAHVKGLQDGLEGRFGGIEAALPKLRVRRDHVFLAQYPDFAYGDDGQPCGIEDGSVVQFRRSTWLWLSAQSGTLNQHVRGAAAAKGRSWVVPSYDLGAFLKRGYCSSSSLFRSLGGALASFDTGGPFHPTQEGHLIEAAGTIPAVCRKLYDGDATCNKPKKG